MVASSVWRFMLQLVFVLGTASSVAGTTNRTITEACVLWFSQYSLVTIRLSYRSHMSRVRVVIAAVKVNKAVLRAAGNFGLIETSGDALGLWKLRLESYVLFGCFV
ncbi:uncharacterized protein DS421_13g415290 [Arachis hypogaea]|nr:uncharacterized protein DS421_13g415290 [Arachis hypogaea]